MKESRAKNATCDVAGIARVDDLPILPGSVPSCPLSCGSSTDLSNPTLSPRRQSMVTWEALCR